MAGIYLHIPFCKKLCHYCDFYHKIAGNDLPLYLDALLMEAEQRRDYLSEDKIKTIYIGGGTPSIMSVKEIRVVLEKLYSLYNIEDDPEITIELNPDDLDREYLNELKKHSDKQDKSWCSVVVRQ